MTAPAPYFRGPATEPPPNPLSTADLVACLRAAADANSAALLDDLPAVLEAIAATPLSPQARAVLAATVATLEALQASAYRLAEVMELEPSD